MRTLVAILAFSPALLHAQAKSPAQPVSTPTLVASSSTPLTSASAVPAHAAVRVSTGVAPARLIHSVDLNSAVQHFPGPRTVVIEMNVDATGKPEDLHLLRGSDPFTTRAVLKAVSQFRYSPATVSGVPVAQAINLEVNVQ